MEPSDIPISVRVAQLNSQLVAGTKQSESTSNLISREGLLDALTVLYDECNADCLKKYDSQIGAFVDKHRKVLNGVKSLRVNISDFEVKNVIGRGHFGEVHVVKEKQTGDVYAMKSLKKSLCFTQKNTWFEEERNIMAQSHSQWLTKLQYAFQDTNHLYFIMEYHPGGDLFGLLQRQGGTIPESAASFYIAELVLALNDLHNMGYIHRDVKPDNILLDRCGHIKLADFGSAAKLTPNGFVNEGMPVGTPDYIAPEVLQTIDNKTNNKKAPYRISCDYWSVGVVGYQLTVGSTPFNGSNTTGTYSKIMSSKSTSFKFPPDIVLSQAYVSLVKGLLSEASTRLGYEQVLKHPLFRQTDFTSLRNQVPPYVPKVDSLDDTSNFFDIPPKKREPNIENFKTKTQFSGKHLPFVGFTYTHDLYEYKRSVPHNIVKNERMEELQKEVNSLQKQLMKNKDRLEDLENMEKKLDDKSSCIENLESLRDRLERDVANSLAECSALRRTLDLERKDRLDLERKALDLIKSAKIKWENSEKTRVDALNLEIALQLDKIQQLTATNSILNEQLQHALQLENTHKTSLDNVHHLNRQSIVGLESRLDKVTSDTQSKISELQNEVANITHDKILLQNNLDTFRYTHAALKEKMKMTEENCNVLLMKLETNQKFIRELENKIELLEGASRAMEEEKNKAQMLEGEIIKLKNDRKVDELENELKKQNVAFENLRNEKLQLQEAFAASSASFEASLRENKEKSHEIAQRSEVELTKILEEKSKLNEELVEAKTSEQSNKLKVQILEDLLKRLENGVTKLETDCDRENLLKEQIERLESQLIQVHECAAVEKQELTQLKSKLWRVEKELSNAEIDKRIYKRELKEVEDEKKALISEMDELKNKMGESSKINESALLELSNLNERLADEILKLKEVIKHLRNEMGKGEAIRSEQTAIVGDLRAKIDFKDNEIASVLKEFEDSKQEITKLKSKLDCYEITQRKTMLEVQSKTEVVDCYKNELENCQRKLRNTELNLEALREACTLLETQVIEYEKIHASYETKEKSLNANTEKLISELARAKEDIQKARKLVNEERSMNIMAETKRKRLEEDVECYRNECSSYKQQCVEFREYSSGLTDELTAAEEKITDSEVTIKSYERQISNLMVESNALKEECSAQLTHLHNTKESNYQLGKQLTEYKRVNKSLLENIHVLEENLLQNSNFYKERELKADGTIQQQTKLIDFLQSKVEESKKKKTLTDKLFGKKENQPPLPVALNYKELEGLLLKERDLNKELRQEMAKVKCERNLKSNKNACETQITPMSPRTKVTLEKIAQSPNTLRDNLSRQNSLQRMYHNIPHRFDSKLCTKSIKCAHCSNSIVLGRNMKYCTECHICSHPRCTKFLPKTCGIPQAYVQHYSESINRIVDANNVDSDVKQDETINVEGWIKIPVRGNTSWDRHYACLTSSTLKIYSQPPNNTTMSPIVNFELKPPNTRGMIILEPVVSEIGTPVATSDLPFIIKIEVTPDTTCWPPKSVILMTLSVQDKEKWFNALQAIFCTSDEQYSGKLIMKINESMQINCLAELNPQTKLLGAEDGLYSYRDDNLLRIAGPLSVNKITLLNEIGVAVMIVDSNQFLITCDLDHLGNLAKCASCSKPTLTFKSVNVNNLGGFHLLEASNRKKHLKLAVATAKQLIIMSYDYNALQFVPVRVLDTAEPTSCVLFTQHSLIVGANKFFEIDLLSFEADEFLDESDQKLSQAIFCYSVGSFPLAIMQIANDPIEYLLCFHEFAIFVDEFGRCSRATEMKWSKLPRSFYFCRPYLYIIQLSSVEVIHITSETCNLMKNSVESLLNVDGYKIELTKPVMIGTGKKGVYLSISDDEVRFIEPKEIWSDSASLSSDSTTDNKSNDLNNSDEEFSLSSSMVQSLDDLSDAETESVGNEDAPYCKQKKVTFNSCVTDL